MLILDPAVKRDLQFDTGTFTMDVNNMDYCSVSKRPFACTDHRGHHIWMHLPPHDASAALRTYLAQKAHAPFTTSCCILVPAWKKASFSRLLHGMTLLRQFDKECPIFRLQNGQQQCASYPVRIYHDAVWPQPSKCNLADTVTAASMKFTGIVKGQPVSIMFDTGSDASFANKSICHTLQLPIEPLAQPLNVQLAGEGHCLSANATCATAVTLKGVCFPVRCFVMNLPAQHDFILGEDFMQMARTRLDYAGGACTLQQGKKTICLPCHVLPAPPVYSERASAAPVSAAATMCSPSKSPNLGMITAARLRQAYDKGCTIFAVQIMSADNSGSVQLQAVPFWAQPAVILMSTLQHLQICRLASRIYCKSSQIVSLTSFQLDCLLCATLGTLSPCNQAQVPSADPCSGIHLQSWQRLNVNCRIMLLRVMLSPAAIPLALQFYSSRKRMEGCECVWTTAH